MQILPCLLAVISSVLPEKSGTVSIPAQEWPLKPGPRNIDVHVYYPGKDQSVRGITPETGLMLSLHNWGGKGFTGTADPTFLADHYNVVVIGVDYLESGPWAEQAPYPYDYGWLQALDALRALSFVYRGLVSEGVPFAKDRIFVTGGSGGGNVTLMANKLAPNTFAVAVDLCGMKRLTNDVAYSLPGGTEMNARYSQDPTSPYYLTPDAQELRYLGEPGQLAQMKAQGCAAKIVTVHGTKDEMCLYADAEEYAANMSKSGLDFTFVPVTEDMVDQVAYRSTGHALGVHALIVDRVAGEYLDPHSAKARRLTGPNNFKLGKEIRYATSGGTWIVDYSQEWPVGRVEARAAEKK